MSTLHTPEDALSIIYTALLEGTGPLDLIPHLDILEEDNPSSTRRLFRLIINHERSLQRRTPLDPDQILTPDRTSDLLRDITQNGTELLSYPDELTLTLLTTQLTNRGRPPHHNQLTTIIDRQERTRVTQRDSSLTATRYPTVALMISPAGSRRAVHRDDLTNLHPSWATTDHRTPLIIATYHPTTSDETQTLRTLGPWPAHAHIVRQHLRKFTTPLLEKDTVLLINHHLELPPARPAMAA